MAVPRCPNAIEESEAVAAASIHAAGCRADRGEDYNLHIEVGSFGGTRCERRGTPMWGIGVRILVRLNSRPHVIVGPGKWVSPQPS